jgi:thiosulfate dehydrogenase
MNGITRKAWILTVAMLLLVGGCSRSAQTGASPPKAAQPVHHAADSVPSAGAGFTPPAESTIPDTPFGRMVREGLAVFTDTQHHAAGYVGNGLNCSNCHLDAGRLANAAPLWAAWGMYPAYRDKDGQVTTYAERVQGCFRYSMNGTPPPAESRVMVALEAYSYWMSKGAPVGKALPGRGYPKKGFKSPQPPDYARGEKVYASDCALCHGDDGQGRKVAGDYVFPPLWGGDSFNWGAGMHRLDDAAAFIKANMPLGRGGMLTDQQAWDVAMFMDAHERPQDPRFTGDVAQTRKQFHDTPMSLYGKVINGHLLGSKPSR